MGVIMDATFGGIRRPVEVPISPNKRATAREIDPGRALNLPSRAEDDRLARLREHGRNLVGEDGSVLSPDDLGILSYEDRRTGERRSMRFLPGCAESKKGSELRGVPVDRVADYRFLTLDRKDWTAPFVAVDVDRPDSALVMWDAIRNGMPEPSFYIEKRGTGHAQFFWMVDPVAKSNLPAFRLYQAVSRLLCEALGGDPDFTHRRVQNPYWSGMLDAGRDAADVRVYPRMVRRRRLTDIMAALKDAGFVKPAYDAGSSDPDRAAEASTGKKASNPMDSMPVLLNGRPVAQRFRNSRLVRAVLGGGSPEPDRNEVIPKGERNTRLFAAACWYVRHGMAPSRIRSLPIEGTLSDREYATIERSARKQVGKSIIDPTRLKAPASGAGADGEAVRDDAPRPKNEYLQRCGKKGGTAHTPVQAATRRANLSAVNERRSREREANLAKVRKARLRPMPDGSVPGVKDVMDRTGLSRSTVKRLLKELGERYIQYINKRLNAAVLLGARSDWWGDVTGRRWVTDELLRPVERDLALTRLSDGERDAARASTRTAAERRAYGLAGYLDETGVPTDGIGATERRTAYEWYREDLMETEDGDGSSAIQKLRGELRLQYGRDLAGLEEYRVRFVNGRVVRVFDPDFIREACVFTGSGWVWDTARMGMTEEQALTSSYHTPFGTYTQPHDMRWILAGSRGVVDVDAALDDRPDVEWNEAHVHYSHRRRRH